jgi:chorismate synthase
VVGEAMAGMEIANAFMEKFGGDSMEEIHRNFHNYQDSTDIKLT